MPNRLKEKKPFGLKIQGVRVLERPVEASPTAPKGQEGNIIAWDFGSRTWAGLTRLESPEAVDTAIYRRTRETFGLAFLERSQKKPI